LEENLKQGIYQYEIIPLKEKTGDNFDINEILVLKHIKKNDFVSIDDENNSFFKFIKDNTKSDELKKYINEKLDQNNTVYNSQNLA
jgi:hypothetical protein